MDLSEAEFYQVSGTTAAGMGSWLHNMIPNGS
jgi:hypothetical protein